MAYLDTAFRIEWLVTGHSEWFAGEEDRAQKRCTAERPNFTNALHYGDGFHLQMAQ